MCTLTTVSGKPLSEQLAWNFTLFCLNMGHSSYFVIASWILISWSCQFATSVATASESLDCSYAILRSEDDIRSNVTYKPLGECVPVVSGAVSSIKFYCDDDGNLFQDQWKSSDCDGRNRTWEVPREVSYVFFLCVCFAYLH